MGSANCAGQRPRRHRVTLGERRVALARLAPRRPRGRTHSRATRTLLLLVDLSHSATPTRSTMTASSHATQPIVHDVRSKITVAHPHPAVLHLIRPHLAHPHSAGGVHVSVVCYTLMSHSAEGNE